MTWNGGQVGWSTFASDGRVKKLVSEDVKGLDFIKRLRPVTYHLNIKEQMRITGNKDSLDFPGKYDIEKIKFSGFIAQEVEKAAIESGYDFNGYTKPQKSTEIYTMRYESFVVPLVKAVQEQHKIIETQQQQIDLLMKRIEALEKK